MNARAARGFRHESTGLVWMLLSAALFGYFGFMFYWPNTIGGEPNWISIVLMWTVRGTAIAFAVSAALTFIHQLLANLLYSVAGLISAIMIGLVLIWHYSTDAHAPISPILLFVFAALNGYGSWVELRQMRLQWQWVEPPHQPESW